MPRRHRYRIKDSIAYKVHRLSGSLQKATMAFYRAHFQLSVPELRVLSVLDSYAPLSPNDVVDIAAMDKGLVSRALAKLAARGLALRVADPHDRRKQVWSLSAAGEALAVEIRKVRARRQAQLLARLSADKQAELKATLDLLFESSETARRAEADAIAARRSAPRSQAESDTSERRPRKPLSRLSGRGRGPRVSAGG